MPAGSEQDGVARPDRRSRVGGLAIVVADLDQPCLEDVLDGTPRALGTAVALRAAIDGIAVESGGGGRGQGEKENEQE